MSLSFPVVSDAEISAKDGRYAMLIPSIMMMSHLIPFLFFPGKFFETFYCGKITATARPHVATSLRWFTFWIIFVAGAGIGFFDYHDEAPIPTNHFFVTGFVFLIFVVHFCLFFFPPGTGVIKGYFKTSPGLFQRLMMLSWIPGNFIFAAVMLATVDFDNMSEYKNIFRDFQTLVHLHGSSKPSVDMEGAATAMLILGLMIFSHVFLFWLIPVKFIGTFYTGTCTPEDVPVVSWVHQFHGSWAVAASSILFTGFYYGGLPSQVLAAIGVSQLSAAVVFAVQLLGLDGGDYNATKPSKFNKMMLGSWIPACVIFGCVFLAAYDSDMV